MAIHVDPPPRQRPGEEAEHYTERLWSWLYQLAEKINTQGGTSDESQRR